FGAYPWCESWAAKPLMQYSSGPAQESSAAVAACRVVAMFRLLEGPGRAPAGNDSRIMPGDQEAPSAPAEQGRRSRTTTRPAAGIIRDPELCRKSCTRGPA